MPSLVGSEMCIRDRSTGAEPWKALLRAPAVAVQDQKYDLVSARYAQIPSMSLSMKERALYGRMEEPLGGTFLNSTRRRPLIRRIEEAEAPHATSFSNAYGKQT